WVRVPGISSGTTRVYLDYSLPNGSPTEEDPECVFDFFDDFEDGTVNDQWISNDGAGDGNVGLVSESGGVLHFEGGSALGGGNLQYITDAIFLNRVYVGLRYRTTTGADVHAGPAIVDAGDGSFWYAMVRSADQSAVLGPPNEVLWTAPADAPNVPTPADAFERVLSVWSPYYAAEGML